MHVCKWCFRLIQIKYCLLLQLVIILLHIHKTEINIHNSIHALYNNIMVAKIGVAISSTVNCLAGVDYCCWQRVNPKLNRIYSCIFFRALMLPFKSYWIYGGPIMQVAFNLFFGSICYSILSVAHIAELRTTQYSGPLSSFTWFTLHIKHALLLEFVVYLYTCVYTYIQFMHTYIPWISECVQTTLS